MNSSPSQFFSVCICYVACLFVIANANAQTSITSLQPASCQRGVTTKLTLRGSNLPSNLRVLTNRSDAKVEIEGLTADSATIAVSMASDASPGELGLWFASTNQPFPPRIVIVDDLPTLLDNGANHSLSTAQTVDTFNAIDGISDGTRFDHYRFSTTAGQRVAFEMLTQAMHSAMDPMIRLLDADGRVLHTEDDDANGPDCRFSFVFAEAGEYVLQVSDSRYAEGGAYHLRIGDFPILDSIFPLATSAGASTTFNFATEDPAEIIETNLHVPAQTSGDLLTIPARIPEGRSAAWRTVLLSKLRQFVEPSHSAGAEQLSRNFVDFPIGISGRLERSRERDSYWLRGLKGQTIRIASRTRSIGCATMLDMQLYNAAGLKLVETTVNNSDEWMFDYTFQEDGEFRLEVGDLLGRGGNEFVYWIEIVPSGSFSIEIKVDPQSRQSFAVEETVGGCAVDLQIARFGYEGEIELQITDAVPGLRILNPRIAAGALAHRLILLCGNGWDRQSFSLLRLGAQALGNSQITCDVTSQSLARLKEPHVISSNIYSQGVLSITGADMSARVFALEPTTRLLFDRSAVAHPVVLQLKRLKEDFKTGVVIDSSLLPTGWSLTTIPDNDLLNLTITRPSGQVEQIDREPAEIPLLVYAELPDRVRWETVRLPVKWIDQPERLEVYPPSIELEGPNAVRQLIVTGFDAKGQPRDWTRECSIVSANPGIVAVQNSTAVPKSDGATQLIVQIGEVQQSIPVTVSRVEHTRRTEFESDVLVALSKQGCNSGACHGSPSGKGNFRLSLRAFDRALDEMTLIREDFGRRVNPIDPDQSLLLLKPMMKLPHGGAKQLHKDDAAYKILRDWIAEGAQADPIGTPRCVRLEVYPNQKRILKRLDGSQQLSVTAHFADNRQRDVSRLAAYDSTNPDVATVDALGLVTPHDRGETVILVRYLEHIESIPLMFVNDVPGFQWQEPSSDNYIDELVNAKLRVLQFLPAPTCSDSVFLRRVYLDVVGILPSIEETNAFLADSSADKRSTLIDQLLDRDEFAKFWALKWGDLLKMTVKSMGQDGVHKYHRWVESAIRSNMPYDVFARELLAASGSTLANPAANFYRTSTDMHECVETVSQVFLGARLQCAKCHNHPFERWTQDNYYGLGAFFNRLQRKTTQRSGEMFVWTAPSGEVTQPRTGQTMKPWLPRSGSIELNSEDDRRSAFIAWLIDAKNPFFARIEANRIWSQLFSRGIVDPIDDFRDSNPPSNEPLLDALAKDFAESGFDRKHLLRKILRSRTYQASSEPSQWNDKDKLYFSHQSSRMLSAEQLLDAINHVLGLNQTFAGLPSATKATQLPAPDIAKMSFLKVFGQPDRMTVCACERVDDSNLGMAIELFNGPLIHEKLHDPNSRFRKSLTDGRKPDEVVRELYLAALCRQPTDTELAVSLQHCQARGDLVSALEDLCWVLLNTDEFLFQH